MKTFYLVLFSIITVLKVTAQPAIILNFRTGGDDLRGGNDNANLVVLVRNGNHVRFENINNNSKWGSNSNNVITKTFPTTILQSDILGIRIETTTSGGIGGDNWNLDRISVSYRPSVGSRSRAIYSNRGFPLFRFTGDARVKQFTFGSEPIPPSNAIFTNFRPDVHGYKFNNNFTNIIVGDITTKGLCGGMMYSSLDYYYNALQIPQQTYQPAEGMPLQSYIYNRQTDAILRNLDKWAEHGFNLDGIRNREIFNWGLQMGSGRLGELITRINSGNPVVLGLIACGRECLCKDGCPGNHQVIAFGYRLGNYLGDLSQNTDDVEIYVYDPNNNGQRMTLKANSQLGYYYFNEKSDEYRWRAYFTDLKYSRKTPPLISLNPRELTVTFITGGDDLRGGNDNLNLTFNLTNGSALNFANVNNRSRWYNNSSQTISIELPTGISNSDISSIKLTTTFGGGIGGDNWNLDSINVKTRINGIIENVIEAGHLRSLLFRFTGERKEKIFYRYSNKIISKIKTGGDDLRGGNDNVHMIILLNNGSNIRFENINDRNNWGNQFEATVERELPLNIQNSDIKGVRLETTFGGGWGGDNWNLDKLDVKTKRNQDPLQDVLTAGQDGSFLHRFTGSDKIRDFFR